MRGRDGAGTQDQVQLKDLLYSMPIESYRTWRVGLGHLVVSGVFP